VFPFDHDGVPAGVAAAEIAAALGALQPRILLFLRNIQRLRTGGPGARAAVIERTVAERTVAERTVTEHTGAAHPGTTAAAAGRRVTVARDQRREEWLVWHRRVADHPGERVEIAFRLGGGQVSPVTSAPLTVFFPTEKETFLGFLIQGPYRTTPARDNIPGDDPSNQASR
jgi:hypothetical protein